MTENKDLMSQSKWHDMRRVGKRENKKKNKKIVRNMKNMLAEGMLLDVRDSSPYSILFNPTRLNSRFPTGPCGAASVVPVSMERVRVIQRS